MFPLPLKTSSISLQTQKSTGCLNLSVGVRCACGATLFRLQSRSVTGLNNSCTSGEAAHPDVPGLRKEKKGWFVFPSLATKYFHLYSLMRLLFPQKKLLSCNTKVHKTQSLFIHHLSKWSCHISLPASTFCSIAVHVCILCWVYSYKYIFKKRKINTGEAPFFGGNTCVSVKCCVCRPVPFFPSISRLTCSYRLSSLISANSHK